ncbi:MAG: hypothetical protein PHH44_05405 [bacterium]|nr:hypothetical protein [bacterium]
MDKHRIVYEDNCPNCQNRDNCPHKDDNLFLNNRLNNLKSSVIPQYFLANWPGILTINIHCGILPALRKEYKDPWIYFNFDCHHCNLNGSCERQDEVTVWKGKKEEIYSTMESFAACFLNGSYDVAIQCPNFTSAKEVLETILS